MGRRKKTQDEGSGTSDWIVTFSDCMTLLLTFFVLLLTFSSFDEQFLGYVGGVMEGRTNDSVLPSPTVPKSGLVQQFEPIQDWSKEGAERPTFERLEPAFNPRAAVEIADLDAYADRKALHIPSRALFWGRSMRLTPGGEAVLQGVASFVKRLPGRVVVCETNPPGAPAPAVRRLPLERAWAVIRYFADEAGVPIGRLNVGAPVKAGAPEGEPAIEITMLNWEAGP